MRYEEIEYETVWNGAVRPPVIVPPPVAPIVPPPAQVKRGNTKKHGAPSLRHRLRTLYASGEWFTLADAAHDLQIPARQAMCAIYTLAQEGKLTRKYPARRRKGQMYRVRLTRHSAQMKVGS